VTIQDNRLSEQEIRDDLTQLKTIAAAHKAPGAALETETITIDGLEVDVFARVPNNLGELYALGLEAADETFLVYQEERFSFAETLDLSLRMARALRENYQIHAGDRVAICARNSPEWCMAYMAITQLGAIAVPMNSWWKSPELKYGLEDSGSQLIFLDPARFSLVQPFINDLDVQIVMIKPEDGSTFPEFYELARSKEPLSSDELSKNPVLPEDSASIMYTSGSTGMPKGVLSTHRNIINALYTWKFVKEITEILRPELLEENPEFQPALLANVPLFHVTGSHAQFLASFIYLRKFVMMYKWDAEVALQLIEEERISVFHGVPTMAWEIMQSPNFDATDLSSLRGVQSGGAPRPPEHLNMMMQKFPDAAIPGLGYGLTETNAIGAIISGKFYASKPNSTGRPTPPVTEVKVVDEAGNTLDPCEVGEICIKGPTVMKGYWNKPEATAEVIKDGWFHSGDIGMLDELGFLIIMDRAKDIVIRGGENIGCAEVEYAISEHPEVSEVSVYGIPDDRLGEMPCASIMLKKDSKLTDTELVEFLQSRIAAFKIPERFYFQFEQLPRIATGKIAKKELRKKTMRLLGLSSDS
jgi:steroid-24-oyl-CoA synthetase